MPAWLTNLIVLEWPTVKQTILTAVAMGLTALATYLHVTP